MRAARGCGWNQRSAELANALAPPDLARALSTGWHFGDAVLFPGGFNPFFVFLFILPGLALVADSWK